MSREYLTIWEEVAITDGNKLLLVLELLDERAWRWEWFDQRKDLGHEFSFLSFVLVRKIYTEQPTNEVKFINNISFAYGNRTQNNDLKVGRWLDLKKKSCDF